MDLKRTRDDDDAEGPSLSWMKKIKAYINDKDNALVDGMVEVTASGTDQEAVDETVDDSVQETGKENNAEEAYNENVVETGKKTKVVGKA